MGKYMNPPAVITSFIGGITSYILGGWDSLAKALVFLMVLDYLTGILKAVYTKTLSSRIGLKGIITKVLYLAIISVVVVAGNILGITVTREMIFWFFIANECISIVENTVEVGVPVPKKLKEVLLQLRDQNESKGG